MEIPKVETVVQIFRIEELRKERKLSRSKLARLANCSYNSLKGYETGTAQRPDMATLQRVADVLGVQLYDLFRRAENV